MRRRRISRDRVAYLRAQAEHVRQHKPRGYYDLVRSMTLDADLLDAIERAQLATAVDTGRALRHLRLHAPDFLAEGVRQ